MRLFIDQMFTTHFADLLRDEGHDVVRAAEVGMARADDADILRTAQPERRVLVTLDAHFGDWAVLSLHSHSGVIRLKVHPTTTKNAANLLVPFLAGRKQETLVNHLVIVSAKQARWIRTSDP